MLFPVKTVTVSGETRYGAQEIIAASGLSEKSNLFTFSGTRVTERIQKSLPYIGEVKITRQLPDAVQIEICSERTEFACFPAQDGYYAVSEDFVVLARYDERPPQLFTVNCTGAVCEIGSTVAFPDEKTASAVSKLISALSGLESRSMPSLPTAAPLFRPPYAEDFSSISAARRILSARSRMSAAWFAKSLPIRPGV